MQFSSGSAQVRQSQQTNSSATRICCIKKWPQQQQQLRLQLEREANNYIAIYICCNYENELKTSGRPRCKRSQYKLKANAVIFFIMKGLWAMLLAL